MIKLQLASESGANGYSLAYHRMNWPSGSTVQQYCSDIERGMCGMSIETMLAIAKALDMNLDYMMFGEISETEREWQQKDALTLIHIIEKAPASQRNYAIRLLKLFIAATGTSST